MPTKPHLQLSIRGEKFASQLRILSECELQLIAFWIYNTGARRRLSFQRCTV
jgi:hypothetical protein